MFGIKSRFDELKETPQWWYNKASDLHASAGAIWMSMEREYKNEFCKRLGLGSGFDLGVSNNSVYKMLLGLSIELLIKSIYVLRNPLVNVPKKHNLNVLINLIDVHLEPEEIKILELLSEYIVWAGKYPVPRNESELDDFNSKFEEAVMDSTKLGEMKIMRYNGALEWDQVDKIWHKISIIFFNENLK